MVILGNYHNIHGLTVNKKSTTVMITFAVATITNLELSNKTIEWLPPVTM